MILFVIISSLVNLALGYALAIHIRRGRVETGAPHRRLNLSGSLAQRSGAIPLSSPNAGWSFDAATVAAVPGAVGSTASDPYEGPHDDALQPDRLAGIEDFRSQLAQLKNLGASPRTPVAS